MTSKVKLGDIIYLKKGFKAQKTSDSYFEGSYPYIQINEVRGITPSQFAISENPVEIESKDICIVWDGANAGTVGFGLNGLAGSTVARMRLKTPEDWNTPFLGRLLQSKFKEINQKAHGKGSTIPHVDRISLEAIEIPETDLDEQIKIAHVLDKVDLVRQKKEQSLNLTKEFLRAVFLDIFGDPVSNPKKFPRKSLAEFGKITTGNTPPRNKPTNYGRYLEWIKSTNINSSAHFLSEASEYLSQEGAKISRIAPAGSVLVTCIAGSPASIGKAAIANRQVSFNQQINAITPNNSVDTYFLYSQFLVAQHLVQAASTQSMKGMVSKKSFQEIVFLLPPKEKQLAFRKIFEKLASTNEKIDASMHDIQNLSKSIFQRLIKTEL